MPEHTGTGECLEVAQFDEFAAAVAEKVMEQLAARDDRPLLTLDQVADRLGLGRRTVQDLVYPLESAPLRSFSVGPRGSRRVAQADLDAYVAARRNGD